MAVARFTPLALLRKLESQRPFTEGEAWGIFRLAAFAEAFGWTILIIGVGIDKYKLPLHQFAIPIAGRTHGTFFILYFVALLITYTSLRWPRGKFVVALVAGVPPYGTLVFEQIAAWQRKSDTTDV